MPFVLDASVTLVWALTDESDAVADRAFDQIRLERAFAPLLWWYEIRDGLVLAERRGRLAPEDTANFLDKLGTLRITLSQPVDDRRVLQLARKHKLTLYDASYLELAERLELPLATLDAELARAARREKVPLLTTTLSS